MSTFLSDQLEATRDAFKRHVHGGKTFSSEEICALVGRFNELIATARYLEGEVPDTQRRSQDRYPTPRLGNSNVLLFTGVRRERHLPDSGETA